MNTKTEAPKKAEEVKGLPSAKNVIPAEIEKKENILKMLLLNFVCPCSI